MTLLCAKENAFVKTRIFSCLTAEAAQGTYNILQCCMLKLENDKGLSTTQCQSAAFTVCSLHSHDCYLSSLHGNVASEKSEKIPPHLQLGQYRSTGFGWFFTSTGGIVFQRCSHLSQQSEFVELVAVQQLGFSSFSHLERLEDEPPLARELFSDRDACVAPKLCNRKWKFELMFLDRYLMNLI